MPIVVDIPRIPAAEIVIDGVIAEAEWAKAAKITGFKVYRPKPDTDPAADTVVRIMSDEHTLYVSFEAADLEPSKVRAGMGRRDSRKGDDYVGMLLDPLGTGERAAAFIVNPLGIQMDGTHIRGKDKELVPWMGSFSSWDARWQSVGRVTDQGYTVELAIPWSSMRHPTEVDKVGALFFRNVSRTAERSAWPRMDPDSSGVLTQLATLGGPGSLPTSKGLSLIPEVTYGLTREGVASSRLGVWGVSPGLTAQVSPSGALQVLATINPDFSQVESDQAKIDVNQRFSLHYKEKRPFFLEGQEWFSHPLDGIIYTRTMVTPLYGARVTSEVDQWTMAAMHVWDRQPSASINEGGGWTEEDLQDRDAIETVARVRRAVGKDGMLGGIYSDRTIPGTNLAHRMGGIDGRVPLGGGVVAEGTLLISDTTGVDDELRAAPAAVLKAQTSGRHFEADVWGSYLSPGFRTENGYLPWSDSLGVGGELELLAYPKAKLTPRVFFSPVDGEVGWHQDGDLRDLKYTPILGTWFSNGALLAGGFKHTGELYEGTWLDYDRGFMFNVTQWTNWLTTVANYSTGQAALYDPANPAIGWSSRGMLQLVVQPHAHLIIGPEIQWEQFLLNGQEEYSGWVGRLKVEAFATPQLWARFLVDRSTFDETNTLEGLLAYEREPGKAVYLGGSYAQQGVSETSQDTSTQWQVFTKLSWVLGY
jgi:hypothetical protein